jgi:Xaa-Pro aminopeptidase
VVGEARAEKVDSQLRARDLDGLLVTHPVNVRYLTGFTGSNGVCLINREGRLFFTDFRYVEQAAEQVLGFEKITAGRDLLGDVAKRLSGRIGFDDAHLSVRAHARLTDAAGEMTLIPAGGLVEEIREIKDAHELAAIAEAARLADTVYEGLCEGGLTGRTELEVARDLERRLLEEGADEPAFPVIVASGPHGARPHAEPRDAEITLNTLVVVDMGARLDGYCSDCTRTFATGRLNDRAAEVYELVRSAQNAGLEAVRAGAACQEADAAAREPIEAAGQGDNFGHGLGHGVGLEVHEAPRLTPTAQGQLEAGNVLTVEPAVYLPGAFGVRIEDLVVVTPDGRDVLTGVSKTLTVVG